MLWVYGLILLVFALYHLRAWGRVKLRAYPQRSAGTLARQPLVSFLVPAWQAAPDIVPFIEAFRALSYSNKSLILCVGGSDDSLSLARQHAGTDITVLEQPPGMGKQKSLQLCYEASRGDIIYLTDIDCRVEDESFTKVLEPVLTGREQVVTGSSKPTSAQQTVGAVLVHWALVRKAEGVQGGYVKGILGRNCALTRAAAEAVGGFNFDAPTGTDYRLAQVLSERGFRIWREPSSEVPTEYAWPLTSYIRKRARWVRNILLFAERPTQNAEFLNALSVVLVPLAMVLAVFASGLLSVWLPLGLALFPLFVVLLMLAHGTLNRLGYLRETLGGKYLRPRTVRGALVNWIGQLAAGLYALYTWVVPGLRKQW